MGSFFLQYNYVVAEAADYVPNLLMIRVPVPFVCTSTGNSDNIVSSMNVMVLFNYLKINLSAIKTNFENRRQKVECVAKTEISLN